MSEVKKSMEVVAVVRDAAGNVIALEILEEGQPLRFGAGLVPHSTDLDVGRKIFGNGVGVGVRATDMIDGSAAEKSRVFDENLELFTGHLRRNRDKLRRFLRAALREVTDGSEWDPSGDGLDEPTPRPARNVPVPPPPMLPPVPVLASGPPPAVKIGRTQ